MDADAQARNALRVHEGFGIPPDCTGVVALMNGPMYHSAPNAYGLAAARNGATVVLEARFEPEELLAMVERHRVTNMHMVPTMFVRLLALPETLKNRYRLDSLVHVSHGAAPCAPDVKRAMIDWWGPIIHEYYAMTETGIICSSDSATWLAKPGCVGRPVPGIDILILDEAGMPVTAGMPGEICVRSEVTSKVSYHRADEKTAAMRRGDFVATGDIGHLDADGVLFISDRKSDMVISGGVNLYPAEIENALNGLPDLTDCAAFGVPDAEFGERMVLVVEGGDALRREDLTARLMAQLAAYKLPRVIYRSAVMPREDSGKIKKRLLRDKVLDGQLVEL